MSDPRPITATMRTQITATEASTSGMVSTTVLSASTVLQDTRVQPAARSPGLTARTGRVLIVRVRAARRPVPIVRRRGVHRRGVRHPIASTQIAHTRHDLVRKDIVPRGHRAQIAGQGARGTTAAVLPLLPAAILKFAEGLAPVRNRIASLSADMLPISSP